MSAPPSIPRDQNRIDADHLKLLVIFHFVGAGLGLIGLLFLLGHFAIFRTVLSDGRMWQNTGQKPPPAEFLAILKWFYLALGTWFTGSGVINLISGLCIRARKHRMFSLVVAGINCVHMPLGTALGVFTIIVLIRESVREQYQS